MGSSKSKVVPVTSEDEIEEQNSSRSVTNCWGGIRQFFSRKTKVVPLASENDSEIEGDDDDDVEQTPNTAQEAPAAATIAVEPAEIHPQATTVIGQKDQPIRSQEVKPSPAIGQKAVRRVRRARPSTSYSPDIRVSSGYFLYYHRLVNDESENESSDDESSSDDDYVDDADIESDVDEIDDRIRVHRFTHRATRKSNGKCVGKGGKNKSSNDKADVSNNTHPAIGQLMMDKMDDDVIDQTDESSSRYLSSESIANDVKSDLSSESNANDVISDDDASSEADDLFVDENDVMFMVSVSWIMHIIIGFHLIYFFTDIAKALEYETDDDSDDDDDGDDEGVEAVVVDDRKAVIKCLETSDLTPPGHPDEVVYEPVFETESETDIDQPSTSYKRDKHATYDFIVQKRFMDVSSDEYIW